MRDQVREAVVKILANRRDAPVAVEWILEVLGGLEDGLRTVHPSAVVDYRQSFITDDGQMFSFVVTNLTGSFEQILFRAYVFPDRPDSASLDFYDGPAKRMAGKTAMQSAVLKFATRPNLVQQLDGVLSQYERIARRSGDAS